MSPYVIPGLKREAPVANSPIDKKSITAAIEYVTTYDIEDMNVRNREGALVFARQLFFYFMRLHTDLSWKDLSRIIRRDHSTAIHAVNRINGFIEIKDPHTLKTIGEIEQFLKNH